MAKEELEKEAEEKKYFNHEMTDFQGFSRILQLSLLLSWIFREYESREKRIAELEKENAELKSKNCWKTCEYAEPKSQWISQHIQDVEQLANAKEIIKKLVHEFYYLCELHNFATDYECLSEAEQFISEVEK